MQHTLVCRDAEDGVNKSCCWGWEVSLNDMNNRKHVCSQARSFMLRLHLTNICFHSEHEQKCNITVKTADITDGNALWMNVTGLLAETKHERAEMWHMWKRTFQHSKKFGLKVVCRLYISAPLAYLTNFYGCSSCICIHIFPFSQWFTDKLRRYFI